MLSRCLGAAIVLAVATATPALAGHHKRHHHRHRAVENIYLHNYGPGIPPASFAYYDGPTRAMCRQSAAAYRGQDGRRHPCN